MDEGRTTVLVVEDDAANRNALLAALGEQGYRRMAAVTGREALEAILSGAPDMVLLALGLPDMDGMDVIHKVRTWSHIPLIVVSARTSDGDKVAALDAGADDYLTKPFSMAELLARIRTTERRLRCHADDRPQGASFTNGDLCIDYRGETVSLAGEELHLTPLEYRLLCLLAAHVGRVLSHQFILREVWGTSSEGDLATLRVFMGALRKKIERPDKPRFIQTRVGVGYCMVRL